MKRFSTEFAGKPLVVEIGRMAQQCHGSCVVQYGETTVLGTTAVGSEPRDIDFVPLSVSYQPKMYAAGRIRSSRFLKREGRPSDDAVLTQRLIDRGIRPLLPKSWTRDVQVICTVLSYDMDNNPDCVSSIAGSLSLALSPVEFDGPVVSVRVGLFDGEYRLNPSESQMDDSDLDLVVTTRLVTLPTGEQQSAVVMIEAGAKEVSEETVLEAITLACETTLPLHQFLADIIKAEKSSYVFDFPEKFVLPADMVQTLRTLTEKDLWDALHIFKKQERYARVRAITRAAVERIVTEQTERCEQEGISLSDVQKALTAEVDVLWKTIVRENILVHGHRIHQRKIDQIRTLSCEVDVLPRVHGSALFTRGETQCLSVVTLGTPSDAQVIAELEEESTKRYMHHYNFPPFSVGEASNRLATGNREIGHGALAERAIEPLLPKKEDFPYTIRVVSEILSSNGSSSMAAVCGSSLSLLAAGVPLSRPAAGIAMGLMMADDGRTVVLTDLQDEEDFGGDMDFKVAGTDQGITAIQMDIKLSHLPREVFPEALHKAKVARMHILETMHAVIAQPRAELSPYAPRLMTLQVHPDMIRFVIGKGGETINKIIQETGAKIDIEESGLIYIASTNQESMEKAKKMIQTVTYQPAVGDVREGVITRLADFGVFVDIGVGKDGLLHISHIDHKRIEKVTDVFPNIGEKVLVQILDIDASGKIALSRKALLKKPEEQK